jgi:hypothetical protein
LNGVGDDFDLEGIRQSSLLEEICSKCSEETETNQLLSEIGPEGDNSAKAVSSLENGIPFFASLLSCNFTFVLNGHNQNLELALQIIIGHTAVKLEKVLLGLIVFPGIDTPGWRFGNKDVDQNHEADLCPLGVDGCYIVCRVIFGEVLKSDLGKK